MEIEESAFRIISFGVRSTQCDCPATFHPCYEFNRRNGTEQEVEPKSCFSAVSTDTEIQSAYISKTIPTVNSEMYRLTAAEAFPSVEFWFGASVDLPCSTPYLLRGMCIDV